MELAAPDIKKEYCRVAINDEGNLTIAIEKGGVHDVDNIDGGHQQEHKHEDKHHHYLRREFFDWRSDFVDYSYSNYEQSYTLPDDVVKDQISAKVEDGILTVTMPKTEPKQKVTKAIIPLQNSKTPTCRNASRGLFWNYIVISEFRDHGVGSTSMLQTK